MKKKNTATVCFLAFLLMLMALTTSVQAPDGSHFKWVDPAYMGPDMFYGPSYPYKTIVGYLEETDWTFTTSWTNHDSDPLNVSAIRIYFDWGKNYTHSFSTPLQIMPSNTEIFQVSNTTPSTEEAPELWTHEYIVYIDRVNSTSPPYENLSPIGVYGGNDFAVLSADHLECLKIFTKFGIFTSSMGGGWPSMMTGLPNITETQVLFTKLYLKLMQGMQYYQMGLFGTAKGHLQDADAFMTEALTVWNVTGTAMEDADMARKNAEANYYNGLANSTLVNAYGWLLFGLGWVFIGIGIIIYGAKKPKAAQS